MPACNSLRIFIVFWSWFGFLLATAYRSSLTTYLTVPLPQQTIDTLDQLLNSDVPDYGSTGCTFKKMFMADANPKVREVGMRYKEVNTVEEGLILTAKRKFAMFENRQFLEFVIAQNFTDENGEETLHIMKECFMQFRYRYGSNKL
ncbi:hypothetical protein Avbf_10766 [Armadillidium vulgare]|nr:hypothetical protein Avbf_10766 [Armadillidium vulgare]